MYYEVDGDGPPLLLLHGAYMTVDMMGAAARRARRRRQVIVPELQGHGRTADVDRPITYEQMADDAAALIRRLGSSRPTSSATAWAAASRCSSRSATRSAVRRLVVVSASFRHDGMQPEAIEMFPTITPEMFAGSPMEDGLPRARARSRATSPRSSGSSTRSTRRRSPGPPTRSAGSPRRR